MKIIKCDICGKDMDISNWLSDIEFSINGTNIQEDFSKEDIEIIKNYNVCHDCFYSLQNLFYLLKSKELSIEEIRDYRYKRNIKSWEKKPKKNEGVKDDGGF